MELLLGTVISQFLGRQRDHRALDYSDFGGRIMTTGSEENCATAKDPSQADDDGRNWPAHMRARRKLRPTSPRGSLLTGSLVLQYSDNNWFLRIAAVLSITLVSTLVFQNTDQPQDYALRTE